ncbi:MAG: DNA repair protein RadC [Alkalispirochaeta sp.]
MIVQEENRIPGASTLPRPRERILSAGADTLSDRELLAVLLGSGSASCDVFTLAGRVLSVLDRDNYGSPPESLMKISGMGPAKATQLAAALELGRRVMAPRSYRIRQPGDAVPLLQHYADRPQEHFITVTLNGAHEVERIRVISIGLVNRTLVHPREVFAGALTDRATAIICAHNHPSGNVTPSDDDRLVTRSLTDAGEVVGIRLLDHIIFSPGDYYSFRDQGAL